MRIRKAFPACRDSPRTGERGCYPLRAGPSTTHPRHKMALPTEVNLPRAHTARYPDRCVRCEGTTDGHTTRLRTHTIGWWTAVLWAFGQGFTTQVPTCRSCGWKIRVQRMGGILLTLTLAALFMIFLWPHIDDFVAKAWRKWVALGLILFCLTPYFV